MTVVVDASIVVAVLVDAGPDGRWAESVIAAQDLVAPHLLPVEVATILRRLILAGEQSPDTATHAHADLLDTSMRRSSPRGLRWLLSSGRAGSGPAGP